MAGPERAASRRTEVAPERLPGWLERFAAAHGELVATTEDDAVRLDAADGSVARLSVPFPPLPAGGDPVAALVAHAARDRRVGVLLMRLGGHAAGVFEGGRLVAS